MPRSLGEPGTGTKALDHQNFRGDTALTEARYCVRCLLAQLIAEAVIDYQRLQRSATASCPGVGQQSQTHAVGAARDTGRNPRRRLEGAESRHAGGEFLVCDHSRATDHLQAARWLEAAIASRISGLGLGYSPCSFASVSQAAFFSLMAINELARPSRASGACAPFLDLL